MECAMISRKIPERGWIPLYLLHKLRRIPTATKLQKMVFLIETEGRIRGYGFFKKYYGPYSDELEVDVKSFSEPLNLMQDQIIEGVKYPYHLYLATAKGTDFIKEIIKEKISPSLLKRADAIIEKYGNKSYQELLVYVYQKYVLPDQTFQQMYGRLSDDLVSLDNTWSESYQDNCPASFLILAVLEYGAKALSKLKRVSDPVLRGVCTSSISDLTAKLVDLTSHCQGLEKCPFSFKSLFSEISDDINFLDYYCGKHGIMQNIMDIDFSDFMDEEELKRLERTLEKIPPSELMY
jgi:hypothetical protein